MLNRGSFFHQVALFEVDALGFVPIDKILAWCHLAWEQKYLFQGWLGLFDTLDSGFPVVCVEGSFFCFYKLGDEIRIDVQCEAIGEKSVTFSYHLFSSSQEKNLIKVTHVYLEEKVPALIPQVWREVFR